MPTGTQGVPQGCLVSVCALWPYCGPSHITINILSVYKNTVISTRFVDDRPLSALLRRRGPSVRHCVCCCRRVRANCNGVSESLGVRITLSHPINRAPEPSTVDCEAEPKSTGEEGAFARFMYGRGGIEVDGKAPPVAVHGSVSPAL
jgi:hypothetical protein